jgi:hypothetical protein
MHGSVHVHQFRCGANRPREALPAGVMPLPPRRVQRAVSKGVEDGYRLPALRTGHPGAPQNGHKARRA